MNRGLGRPELGGGGDATDLRSQAQSTEKLESSIDNGAGVGFGLAPPPHRNQNDNVNRKSDGNGPVIRGGQRKSIGVGSSETAALRDDELLRKRSNSLALPAPSRSLARKESQTRILVPASLQQASLGRAPPTHPQYPPQQRTASDGAIPVPAVLLTSMPGMRRPPAKGPALDPLPEHSPAQHSSVLKASTRSAANAVSAAGGVRAAPSPNNNDVNDEDGPVSSVAMADLDRTINLVLSVNPHLEDSIRKGLNTAVRDHEMGGTSLVSVRASKGQHLRPPRVSAKYAFQGPAGGVQHVPDTRYTISPSEMHWGLAARSALRLVLHVYMIMLVNVMWLIFAMVGLELGFNASSPSNSVLDFPRTITEAARQLPAPHTSNLSGNLPWLMAILILSASVLVPLCRMMQWALLFGPDCMKRLVLGLLPTLCVVLALLAFVPTAVQSYLGFYALEWIMVVVDWVVLIVASYFLLKRQFQKPRFFRNHVLTHDVLVVVVLLLYPVVIIPWALTLSSGLHRGVVVVLCSLVSRELCGLGLRQHARRYRFASRPYHTQFVVWPAMILQGLYSRFLLFLMPTWSGFLVVASILLMMEVLLRGTMVQRDSWVYALTHDQRLYPVKAEFLQGNRVPILYAAIGNVEVFTNTASLLLVPGLLYIFFHMPYIFELGYAPGVRAMDELDLFLFRMIPVMGIQFVLDLAWALYEHKKRCSPLLEAWRRNVEYQPLLRGLMFVTALLLVLLGQYMGPSVLRCTDVRNVCTCSYLAYALPCQAAGL